MAIKAPVKVLAMVCAHATSKATEVFVLNKSFINLAVQSLYWSNIFPEKLELALTQHRVK